MDNKKKKRFSVKEYIMPKHIVQKLIGTTNHWNAYLAQDLLSLLLLLQKKKERKIVALVLIVKISVHISSEHFLYI